MPSPIAVTYPEAYCILSERQKIEVDKLAAIRAEKWSHPTYSHEWVDAWMAELDQRNVGERIEKALACREGLNESRAPITFFVPGIDHLLLAVE